MVASTDVRIDRFYKPILRELVNAGVKVYAIAPSGEAASQIADAGAEFVPWHLDRRSLNPFSNIWQMWTLIRIYSRIKPDVVHHYTVKPNLYGALAAWICAVPVTFTGITGLGQLFSAGGGLRRRTMRGAVRQLFRNVVAELSDRLIFQTEHDINVLLGNRGVRRKAHVVSGGAGVDTRYYDVRRVSSAQQEAVRKELNIPSGAPVVLMASRLLYEKGVGHYVAAAGIVKARCPQIRFLLAGDRDPGNFGSVAIADVQKWHDAGVVDLLGFREDIRTLLALADVVVHPTYYPEGIPRILIEASSMSKPIVGTSIPGVEQILSNRVNGLVVPPRDVGAVAAAIQQLVADADACVEFGNAGRRLVEEQFDSRLVVKQHLEEYRAAWSAFLHPGERAQTGAPAPARTSPAPVPPQKPQPHPPVSVIVPARDADATLGVALDSILSQDYDGDLEVIVADGSGDPQTAEILRERPAVRTIENPHKTIGFGIVFAIRASTGDILVRCDAHSFLPSGYVRRAVETLQRTGSANVGGRQLPVGTTLFERAVAMAMIAVLGAGDARHRVGGKEGPVDTVYLGTFRRTALASVGGFDPHFFHNQDYEVNWRLREKGETIWFDPTLVVEYRPRSTWCALARQYFNYGRWKAAVLLRHPRSLRSRHLAPPMLLVGLVVSALAAAIHKPFGPWAALLPSIYLLMLVVFSVVGGVRGRKRAALLVPLVLATMHISWAIGFFLPARPGNGRASRPNEEVGLSEEERSDAPPVRSSG